MLGAKGDLSCGELVDLFGISQSTISHHLKILADAGVVAVRPEGNFHFASLDPAIIERTAESLSARLSPAPRRRKTRKTARAA